jgi:hypothetical protein
MDFDVKNGKLIITIDLSNDEGISSSGKSRIVASTRGNQVIPGTDGAVLGLNLYRRV